MAGHPLLVERRRLTLRASGRQLQVDATDGSDEASRKRTEVGGFIVGRGQVGFQDGSGFGLHGTTVVSGPHAQPGFQLRREATHGDGVAGLCWAASADEDNSRPSVAERYLTEARLPPGKSLDGFDFNGVPMISKA